jgi:hypothetical protein
MSLTAPFPRDFVCEHTPTKSRVFAVLASPGRPDTLKAVLTCSDPLLAERAASVLASLARAGGGPAVDAAAEGVQAALPTAPAGSFREACQRLRTRQWPQADASPVDWHDAQVRDAGNVPLVLRDEQERTPFNARLVQLEGKVFRITRFAEYHVHDADRLLHAAMADGWIPATDDLDGIEPDDDLLDALMHLLNAGPTVPGADVLSEESKGRQLTAAGSGDELASWQEEPVTAEFRSGWELRAESAAPLNDPHTDIAPGEPDFAVLFPIVSCELDHADEDDEMDCEACGDWRLTPRTADILYTALLTLSEEAYDDARDHDSAPVSRQDANDWLFFHRLPRLTWNTGAEWRRQVARACDDLALDLAVGNRPIPRNSAEEMALHLALRDAPGYLELAEDGDDQGHEELPRHADDYDWGACSEFLFQDHDILTLFDEGMDGFEDPGTEINRTYGVGDLRPQSWFTFFANVEPRDPSRGFRR